MVIATIWCECLVCEWAGLTLRDERFCFDCGAHLTSQCYAAGCKDRACLFLSDVWSCVRHVPVFADDDEYEHWTIAQIGDYEVVSVEGYSIRGVGSLRMAVLTLPNGLMVSVPQDAVYIASERRQRLSGGAYGHALWWANVQLSKTQQVQNYDCETKEPIREPLPALNSALWECQYPDNHAYPIPLFRELETVDESSRWIIRYTVDEGRRALWRE